MPPEADIKDGLSGYLIEHLVQLPYHLVGDLFL
jgi:hypothetical protein